MFKKRTPEYIPRYSKRMSWSSLEQYNNTIDAGGFSVSASGAYKNVLCLPYFQAKNLLVCPLIVFVCEPFFLKIDASTPIHCL